MTRCNKHFALVLAFAVSLAGTPAGAEESGSGPIGAQRAAPAERTATARSISGGSGADRPAAPRSILDRAVEAVGFGTTTQRNRRTRRTNPYGTLSYVLMGAGGTIAVYGMTHTSGVECDIGGDQIGCRQTKSKSVIFSGLGAAGLGLWLFVKGEGQRNMAPSIWFDGRTIVASKRWSF